MAALSRIMPNIGGPRSNKRRILGNVANSITLYGAELWGDWVDKMTYRKLIEKPQRKIAIRIASGYRTVSTKAIQVIAGTIPIHQLVKERKCMNGVEWSRNKSIVKENIINKWQLEWDSERKTGQWTKRLIPDIKKWINRKHGETEYYLTQFLSGHGCLRSYLFPFGLALTDTCLYCGERDTPEHVIFKCIYWKEKRKCLENRIGNLEVENIIGLMLESANNWKDIATYIKEVLREKHDKDKMTAE